MTSEQIQHAIDTGELKLQGWRKFTHYGIVVFIFFIPSLHIFSYLKDYFQGTPITTENSELWFIGVCMLIGVFFYILQKRRLKFQAVATKLTTDEIHEIIDKVSKILKWELAIVKDGVVVAKTHPSFLSGSWGEQITIIIDTNKVLVNSICDPDERSSVVSMGRNRRNVNRLISQIAKASN